MGKEETNLIWVTTCCRVWRIRANLTSTRCLQKRTEPHCSHTNLIRLPKQLQIKWFDLLKKMRRRARQNLLPKTRRIEKNRNCRKRKSTSFKRMNLKNLAILMICLQPNHATLFLNLTPFQTRLMWSKASCKKCWTLRNEKWLKRNNLRASRRWLLLTHSQRLKGKAYWIVKIIREVLKKKA